MSLFPRARTVFQHGRTMSTLAGKVAIVTASTDGIGYAIARRLGQDGAKVVISSRKQENVDKALKSLTEDNIDVKGIVCHVGDSEQRKALVDMTVKEYGNIDILVANAGINPVFCPILDVDEKAWSKIFDVNVKSTFLLIKEVVPHMNKETAAITIVSSIGGYKPLQGLGAYCVSKTALFGLTNVLATELGPSGVRVNCIAPGIVETKFSEQLWKTDSIKDAVSKTIPLGRFASSNECAGLVSFLSSEDASYITGETIAIAGGMESHL